MGTSTPTQRGTHGREGQRPPSGKDADVEELNLKHLDDDAAQQGANTVSFPDLSGLRATAPSRGKASRGASQTASTDGGGGGGVTADIVQRLDTHLTLADIAAAPWLQHGDVNGSSADSSESILLRTITLAWAITLYHLQAHEADSFVFTQVDGDSAQEVRFHVDRDKPSQLSLQELDDVLRASRRQTSRLVGDTAVVSSPRAQTGAPTPSQAVTLFAHLDDNGHLGLEMHASGSVHSPSSAFYQLRQLESLIESFADPDRQTLPALAARRYTDAFLATDNLQHSLLDVDIGAAGLSEERLEHQFERRAQENPDAIALDFRFHIGDDRGQEEDQRENVRLSYKELDELANGVAHALADAGAVRSRDELGSDDHIIALFLPKSPETFICILGVAKANASWCPLDVEWPIARQEALLKKSKARWILASTDHDHARLRTMSLGDGVTILRADHIVAQVRQDCALRRPLDIQRSAADQLAYLVWTSGTTGLPKAVGVQHSAAVQAIRALQQVVPHEPPIRYLQFSEYTFDLSIMDEFWTWGLCGTVCSGSRALHLDSLTGIANATGTTHVILTPAVSAEIRRDDVPSMKVLINGGEKLSQVVADEWSRDCCLLNLYGPAEATLIAMNRQVPEGDEIKAPNIGIALPTTSLALIDRHGDIVPRGAIGELTIGGPQLARGYVGDPGKTAEKFIDHPSLGRVYRTGDLTRQLWTGEIEYLGREDDQVKVNGVRIELLEINATIKDCHEEVKDSDTMALPRPDNPESLQIVNFSVVPRAAGDVSKDIIRTDSTAARIAHELRAAALLKLPSNMVPTHFLILSRFPKTSSAKIDRQAIRKALENFDYMAWERDVANDENEQAEDDDHISESAVLAHLASAVAAAYGVSADEAKARALLQHLAKDDLRIAGVKRGKGSNSQVTAAEALVRRLLSEVCGIEAQRIGRKTPLPALGLTSFKAMSLTRKLHAAGVKCSVLSIIQHNTLATLAAFIAAQETRLPTEQSTNGPSPPSATIEDAPVKPTILDAFSKALRPSIARHLRRRDEDIVAVLPCTPLQEGMLIESSKGGSYWPFRKYAIERTGVEPGKLIAAIRQLVENVESFRTGFLDISDVDADLAENPLPFQPTFVQVVNRHIDAVIQELVVPSDAEYEPYVQARAAQVLPHDALSGRAPVAIWVTTHGEELAIVLHAHHATYDGLTLSIIQELLQDYYGGAQSSTAIRQFREGLPFLIPLNKTELEQQHRCWKEGLKDRARQPESRFPDVRDTRQGGDGARLLTSTRTATTKWATLEQTAAQHRCSPRIIAQVVWARLLAAHAGVEDVLIGETLSGRDKDSSLFNVMGPMFTTVPVPISFKKGQTFSGVIDETTAFHEAIAAHQHAPLALIRDELNIPHDQVILGTVFVFNSDSAVPQASDAGIKFRPPVDFGASVEHDVALQLTVHSDQSIEIEVNALGTRISDRHLDVLAGQYDALLAAVCARSETDSYHVATLLPDELRSISAVTPWAHEEISTGNNPASWLSNWAERSPSSPALAFHHVLEPNSKIDSMTYYELSLASGQLATYLASRVGRQQTVAVCLKRQPATYIALLAILLSSNVYLPVDEALPDERKQLLVKDSGAKFLITDRANVKTFDGLDVDSLIVQDDIDWSKLAQGLPETAAPTRNTEDLAFCLYTSGSTGRPKGCLLTVGNLSTAIEAFFDVIETQAPGSFKQPARYLARSSEAFDVHLKEVLLALRTGSCIVTAPREVILDDLGLAIQALRPTHAAVVPSLFYTGGRRILPEDIPSLRVLIVGGEKVTTDIISSWGSQDEVVVLNAYGPTEVTIGISMSRIREHSLPSNIGKAFPGSQYWVMHEVGDQLEPVLRGQVGELCVSGPQVGAGYLAQQSSAFTSKDGRRLYRTGDLARMGVGDEVHYAGRLDASQVKVRGARLELSEVDSKLQELAPPGAIVTTVLTSHQEMKDDHLVSFVQMGGITSRNDEVKVVPDDLNTAASLLAQVRRALPAHMVPSLIIPVQAMPLAFISGKVNTRALAELYQGSSRSELRTETAPSTHRSLDATEQIIAEEARHVLRLNIELTPSTNLFEAGMDSLSAIRLASRIRKRNVEIDVSTLMTGATIESIASDVKTGETSPRRGRPPSDFDAACDELNASLDGAIRARAERTMPCMPLQSALISISRSRAEEALYVGNFRLSLHKGVDIDRLRDTFLDVLKAHEIYRTIFPTIGKVLGQVVLQEAPAGETWLELQVEDDKAMSDELLRLSRELIAHLDTQAPLRIVYLPQAHQIVILVHHALYDGESVQKLLSEVSDRYSGHNITPSAQFHEVVRSWYLSITPDSQAFWRDQLDGFTYTPWPNLNGFHKSAPPQRFNVEMQSRMTFPRLKRAAQRLAVPPQALLISIFANLYGKYVGEDVVTFGVVLRGRSFKAPRIDEIHGPCVTTVPLVVHGSERHPQELVKDVQKRLAQTGSYQYEPISKIAQIVKREGPLFNTLFAFTTREAGQLAFASEPQVSMDAEFDFAFEVEACPSSGNVRFFATFRDTVLNNGQAQIIVRAFEEMLCSIDVSAGRALKYPREILSVSNSPPKAPATVDQSFIARFRAHSHRQPDQTALVFAEAWDDIQSVSYEELDKLSTHLAQALVAQAAAKIVAVMLTKSPKLYALIIAIWKAGKTYLPLDPSLPSERVQYMVETARDVTIVTTSQLASTLPGRQGAPVLLLEHLGDSTSPRVNLPDIDLDTIAYLLFTSGSTGRPKGCLISQRALSAALLSWDQNLPLSSTARMLQLASIGFDVSLIEICMPLSRGASFASAPKDLLLEDLEQTLHKLGITCADLPAVLTPALRRSNLPPLEWLMTGGDMMSEATIKEWAPHGQLINAWGPTETTIGNTLGFVRPNATRNNVGSAYACSSVFVLDGQRNPALRGAIGELAIGGPQVGEGYIGQPELTQERFVRLSDGTTVYLTGDRGRLLADGIVECLGRMEQGQVKVNGQRIELDEISSTLAQPDGVSEAETLYIQHPTFTSKQLVAFLSFNDARPSQSNQLGLRDDDAALTAARMALTSARSSLAAYMVPAHILPLAGRIPLTNNNKTDRKALQVFFETQDAQELRRIGAKLFTQENGDIEWSETGTHLRNAIASFCEVDADSIGPSTSVYHLGLDSISATILARHLSAREFDVAVQDILQAPSIMALASKLDSNATSPRDADKESLQQLIRTTSAEVDQHALAISTSDVLLPCSPLQAGMLAQFLISDGKAYLHSHTFSTRTSIDVIEAAWHKVVENTDILRTTFHFITASDTAKGKWCQVIRGKGEVRISRNDHAGQREADRDLVRPGQEEEFLARGPHSLSIETSTEGQLLITLTLHHALYDGTSLPLLLRDFDRACGGHELEPRPAFVDLLPHLLSKQTDVDYWIDDLHGVQTSELLDPDKAAPTSAELQRQVKLDLRDAKSRCQELGATLQVVASLAFAKLLSSLTRSSDVVFGQVFALRQTRAGAEAVIGPAFNTVPVRVTLDDIHRPASQQIRLLQDRNDAGRVHRSASLRDILAATRRNESESELFQALFDFGTLAEDLASLESLAARSTSETGVFGQYPLNLGVVQGPQGVHINLTLNSALAQAHPPEALAQRYEAILCALLSDPSSPVGLMPDGRMLATLPPAVEQRRATQPNGHGRSHLWQDDWEELVWRAVAQAASVDVQDLSRGSSLAALGLDSISAIGISSSLRKRGIKLSAAQILRGATLGRILDTVAESEQHPVSKPVNGRIGQLALPCKAEVAQRLNVDKSSIEDVLPLLPGQAWQVGLWLRSGRRQQVYSFPIRLPAKLDIVQLQKSWSHLVERHACLRTTFASVNDSVAQVVFKANTESTTVQKVTVKADQVLEDAVAELLTAVAQEAFDFFTPPVSVHLLQERGDDRQDGGALVLRLFHGLYDAISLDVLLSDLAALYEGASPSDEATFGRVITAVGHSISSDGLSDQNKAFWTRALEGAEPTLVTNDEDAPNSRRSVFWVEPAAYPKVRQAQSLLNAKQHEDHDGLSLQHIFIAAVTDTIGALVGVSSPTIMLLHAGRTSISATLDGQITADVDRLAIPTATLTPVRVRRAHRDMTTTTISGPKVLSAAREVSADLLRRLDHEQSWLGDIYASAGLDGLRGPISNVVLNLVWFSAPLRSAAISQSSTAPAKDKGSTAWSHFKVGEAVDFERQEPMPRSRHALDDIDIDAPGGRLGLNRVAADLSIDLVLDETGDSVAIAVQSNNGALGEPEIKALITDIVGRVEAALASPL